MLRDIGLATTSGVLAVWRALTDAVYPPCCGSCTLLLAPHETAVCNDCLLALKAVPDEADLRYNPGALRFALTPVVVGAASGFLFEPTRESQRLVHAMKYENRPDVGVRMGRFLGLRFANSPVLTEPVCCVPIPLHGRRYMRRGYNQSYYLAQGIAAVGGPPMRTDLLKRIRATKSQTGMSQEERYLNVKGAFRATKPVPKRILLLDDVLTTGATLLSAVGALQAAGAERIHILTLCRAA